jgi:hypothetical protein
LEQINHDPQNNNIQHQQQHNNNTMLSTTSQSHPKAITKASQKPSQIYPKTSQCHKDITTPSQHQAITTPQPSQCHHNTFIIPSPQHCNT